MLYFFVKFNPKYFVFLNKILSCKSVSLISFLGWSMPVYRNIIDSGILILYPAIFLSLFINNNNFFCGFHRIFYIQDYITYERDSFISFFPNLDTFYFLSCLIALAKTSITMLNTSGKNGHLCLVPSIRGKAFNLSPLSIMLAVSFS